jgi:hypothetical protein
VILWGQLSRSQLSSIGGISADRSFRLLHFSKSLSRPDRPENHGIEKAT